MPSSDLFDDKMPPAAALNFQKYTFAGISKVEATQTVQRSLISNCATDLGAKPDQTYNAAQAGICSLSFQQPRAETAIHQVVLDSHDLVACTQEFDLGGLVSHRPERNRVDRAVGILVRLGPVHRDL